MTLDTRIYVQGPIPPRELHAFCNPLIGGGEQTRFSDRPDTHWRTRELTGIRSLANEPDQGLDGWLMIYYREGKPLRLPGDHLDYCDEDCDLVHVPCWLEISLDTAYGYRKAKGPGPGGNCGALHGWFVLQVGLWLVARNVCFGWHNEFTGEDHQGFEGLEEMGRDGANAAGWFANVVVPALPAMMEDLARREGKD